MCVGTNGEITIAADFAGGMKIYSDTDPGGREVQLNPAGFFGSFEVQWQDIVSSLQTGLMVSSTSPPSEATQDLATVEALYRSVSSRQWEPVTDNTASLEIPAEQLEFLDAAHGMEPIQHGGRGEGDLRQHLTGVRQFMKDRLSVTEMPILSAALFHSVYGTEGFQGIVLPISKRAELRDLIGHRAEWIAFLNCQMCRASLDQAVEVYRSGRSTELAIKSRPELGGETFALSEAELVDLLKVHLGDFLQQVAAYNFWNYRRRAYAAIAATLSGRFAQVYAETMAQEPDDAPREIPEMVRARQQGIFDQVQSGEVSYDALLSGKSKSKL